MRECPKSGYKDLPCWRNNKHKLYTSYCHISELKEWDEDLAARVEGKRAVTIGQYIYHQTKAGYIWRIHKQDSRDGVNYYEPEQEKRYCLIPTKGQLKLLDMENKIDV